LTLHFYSPAAYTYVRQTFKDALPHPSTLRKWYSSVDAKPGFTLESLKAVEIKVKEMKSKGKKLICALMMDEMHIKENVVFKGDRLIGHVNYGIGSECCDSLPKATQALVFMLVSLNSNWKVPVGYFLINGIGSTEKANLVNACLDHLCDTEVIVKTLTFDGTVSNFSMAKCLGADFTLTNLKPFLKHPESETIVHIILDPAHMLKLCRNTLGDWKTIFDENMVPIKWKYFKQLVQIQEEIGLHLGTKIRKRHIKYHKEKMKVLLAAQTFSSSVSDALSYCSETLNLDVFKNCEATITLCQKINNIFDFLNTRNFLSKAPYKKPLRKANEDSIINFIHSSIKYLQNLYCVPPGKDENVIPIIKSTRKTGFIGLIITLKSIENLFNDTVKTEDLEFLLTYKLSQDHLEMFFSAIRARGGFNNNPTALQFESTYKRLLVHTEIMTSSGANCIAMNLTKILSVTSRTKQKPDNLNVYVDMLCAEVTDDDLNLTTYIEGTTTQQTVVDDIVEYIAGFIVRKLEKKIISDDCIRSLTRTHSEVGSLLNIKNRGGLRKPSVDVIHLCQVAERVFKMYQSRLSTSSNIINFLIIKATSRISINKIFLSIAEHILNQEPLNNHLLQIVHIIFQSYFRIRIHHYCMNESQPDDRIRSFLTKTIHFKNQ